VQTEARRLAKDLSDLRTVRQRTAEERLKVAAASSALEKDRNALAQLMVQRRTEAEKTMQEFRTANVRIQDLASEATDLRALIASLNEDAQKPEFRGSSTEITNQIASAGVARNVPLDGLRGDLKLPANGELAANFGSLDGSGGRLAGIYLETLPGSGVTSPCDGKIMFAGPFRGYGQMLIIAANGGYHVLLAGLTNIDGVQGQVVLAGEPLGRMGWDRASGQARTQQGVRPETTRGNRLYIEFRRNGVPVDPVPWFAALRERVSG
jgi:septal ring factor EnvC (AmiA/AmiB activator)